MYLRESVEKLQHCQKTPALVTIFCQKSPISSEKSDIVGKLWYCRKTLISSENSDFVGKLRYCQKTPIFMMNISILNGGKLVRHPYSLVLRHSTYTYVGIGSWHFYPWVKGTPRYEGFKKALYTGFFEIWNQMPIPNCRAGHSLFFFRLIIIIIIGCLFFQIVTSYNIQVYGLFIMI